MIEQILFRAIRRRGQRSYVGTYAEPLIFPFCFNLNDTDLDGLRVTPTYVIQSNAHTNTWMTRGHVLAGGSALIKERGNHRTVDQRGGLEIDADYIQFLSFRLRPRSTVDQQSIGSSPPQLPVLRD